MYETMEMSYAVSCLRMTRGRRKNMIRKQLTLRSMTPIYIYQYINESEHVSVHEEETCVFLR